MKIINAMAENKKTYTYIFDLESSTDNNEQYKVDVKVNKYTLDSDNQMIVNNSDCEKRDYHNDAPFTLNEESQSKSIVTESVEICYRTNQGEWKRKSNGGLIKI